MKRGKKYQDAVKAFDKTLQYDVAEAIALVKTLLPTRFFPWQEVTVQMHYGNQTKRKQ